MKYKQKYKLKKNILELPLYLYVLFDDFKIFWWSVQIVKTPLVLSVDNRWKKRKIARVYS